METNNNTSKWVIGVVLILIVVALLWWWKSSKTSQTPGTDTSGLSTTTTSKPNVVVEQKTNLTVNALLASLGDASTFYSYFTSTGVSATTTGKGPYTVFLPLNDTFGRLKAGTITNLSAAEKKRLVQYHVVTGRALDVDSVSFGNIPSLSRDVLNFNANKAGALQVNSSYVLKAYKASNGMVYIISDVLIPPIKK